MRGKPITRADLATARRMRLEGRTRKEIAAALGRTLPAVMQMLRRHRLPARRTLWRALKPRVLTLWHNGAPAAAIAADLGVSSGTVCRALHEAGIRHPTPAAVHNRRLRCNGGESFAALRRRVWEARAVGEGYPGAYSEAQLAVLRLLRERGPMTARQLAEALGRASPRARSAPCRCCAILAGLGLVAVSRRPLAVAPHGRVNVYALAAGYPKLRLPGNSRCKPNRAREPRVYRRVTG